MSDLLEEANLEYKEQQKILFLKKILPAIIIGVTIVALSIGMYNYNENTNKRYNEKIGGVLLTLLQGVNVTEELSKNSFDELANSANNKQKELIELVAAQKLLQDGKENEALTSFEKIAESENYYNLTRSFSKIIWMSIILDKVKIEETRQLKMRKYIESFKNEQDPFYYTATLFAAVFYKKNNHIDLAKKYAILIKDSTASNMIKSQAEAILSSL